MLDKIERGQQIGLERCVEKEDGAFWYFYAVQKKECIYYVYECEIAEKNMACEIFEYEKISKFFSVKDVMENFPNKYGTDVTELHVLKGEKIFNVEFYAGL